MKLKTASVVVAAGAGALAVGRAEEEAEEAEIAIAVALVAREAVGAAEAVVAIATVAIVTERRHTVTRGAVACPIHASLACHSRSSCQASTARREHSEGKRKEMLPGSPRRHFSFPALADRRVAFFPGLVAKRPGLGRLHGPAHGATHRTCTPFRRCGALG